eukprot:scaffold7559_cov17-Tisochrysis_lutea.AAC.2
MPGHCLHFETQVKNVARCWTYETSVLVGKDRGMQDIMPPNEYYEYFGPDYRLHVSVGMGVNVKQLNAVCAWQARLRQHGVEHLCEE